MDPIGKGALRDSAAELERAAARAAGKVEQVVEVLRESVQDMLHRGEVGKVVARGGVAALHDATANLGMEVLLHRAGLSFDGATRAWLARHGAEDLLRVLVGFKLDEPGFVALVRRAEAPGELARIKDIADYIHPRPWIHADLQTLVAVRDALPANGFPSREAIEKAILQADMRFQRDYTIVEPWVAKAHEWQFLEHNGQAGDEGASYWLRSPSGVSYLAKVPPQPRRGVNERVGYALYTSLGIPVNEVRFGQRDWVPLLTLHKRLPGEPVGLNRVAHEIGIDKADYRVGGWPYPADNIGTGPSTWNRPDAEEYLARIRSRLADPAAFDKLHFAAQICNDPDLKPGNILATVAGHTPEGRPVYNVHRIDFGIMMDGYAMRDLKQDLALFGKYLEQLDAAANRVYLRNVLPTMKQFASLSDQQLSAELLGGVRHRSDGQPVTLISVEREQQMVKRLLQKRDMLRAWLERHPDLAL